MPLTVYCEEADVAHIWSDTAVLRRADDNDDGDVEASGTELDVVANCIERATVYMNKYLLRRYTVAVIGATTWAKWCCATIAAYYLGTRRGNPAPQPIEGQYKEFAELLKQIEAGEEALPADDGLAREQFDNSPSVTNYAIDGRFRRAKVRRIPETSTGGAQSPGLQQNNTVATRPFDFAP